MGGNIKQGSQVRIEFIDRWHELHGDRLWDAGPEDANPAESRRFLSEIRKTAELHNGSVDATDAITTETTPPNHARGFEFGLIVSHTDVLSVLIETGGAIALLKTAQSLLIQWMKNRASRSIQIGAGGVEVSISGMNDVEKALQTLEELHRRAHGSSRRKPKPIRKAGSTRARSDRVRRGHRSKT